MRIAMLFALSAFLFVGCNSTKVVPYSLDSLNNSEVFYRIERTPCFGTCPVFTMQITRSGRVLYNGKQNTPRTGSYSAQLTEDQIDAILSEAAKTGFFEVREKFPSGDQVIADLPTAKIFLKTEENSKEIINGNYANPNVEGEAKELKKLIDFERFVQSITESLEYKPLSGGNQ